MVKRLRLADVPFIVKIGFTPCLALVMLLITAGIAVIAQRQTVHDLQRAINTEMTKSLQIQKISERITETHGRLYILLTHQAGGIEPKKIAGQTKKLVADMKRIRMDLDQLRQGAPADQQQTFLQLCKELDATTSAADLVSSMMTADFSAAASFIAPFEQSYQHMVTTLSKVVTATQNRTYALARDRQQQALQIQKLLISVAILTFLIVLGIMIWSAMATRKDILGLAQATEKLASGDNAIHLSHLARKDELGAIVRSLTVFRDAQLRIIQMRKESEAAQAARVKETAAVITALGEGMEHLASCDFSYRLKADFPKEYLPLQTAFNESMGELENTIRVISSVTADILAEAGQSPDKAHAATNDLKETSQALVQALHCLRENTAAADQRRQKRHAEEAARAKKQAEMVDDLGSGLNALSAGDLTRQITSTFPDEYVRLRDDFNTAMRRLETTLSRVQLVTNVIRSGSDNVNQAVDDLSSRTEHQAATLEETAASLNQITTTVKSTADGAASASEAIARAKKDALSSGEIVKDTVDAMHEIKTSADQISQIVGAIDEITFQTNLLSLNASVEAARAGDAGKGFAVVATEVRELSHRTATMAKEIKKLITASEHRVRQGVDLVEETGKTIERIVGQIVDINDVINQIANSAKEQSTGLEQINTAVTDMDTVTQQNAAMVQETTGASQSLAHQAETLSTLIGHFKLKQTAAEPESQKQAPAKAPADGDSPQQDAPRQATGRLQSALKKAAESRQNRADSAPKKIDIAHHPDVHHTPQQTAHEILQRLKARRLKKAEPAPETEDDENSWEEF